MHVCTTCAHVRMSVCVYEHVHEYMCVHEYNVMSVRMSACAHECMNVCVYEHVRMSVSTCVRMSVCVCV